jgi:hypothetical protein
MLKVKPGVTLLGLQPQMLVALMAAHDLYTSRGVDCVITAGNDGVHSETSEHYAGRAIDLRTNNLPNPSVDGPAIAHELTEALGADYQCIFERDHVHLAYKPKRPPWITP